MTTHHNHSTPITCIAIDDEPMALLVVEQFCRRHGGMELATFSEPRVGLEAIRRQHPNLVFLDIQMNSISGLDVADALPPDCCLVFTTAHAQYALEGFNLDAVDFLLKPFSYDRFEKAVEKALRRIGSRTRQKVGGSGCIVVKQEYSNVSIEVSSILYVEALGNYVKIYLQNGRCVLTRTNLKAIQQMLPEGEFLRTHRSYIIARRRVESFTRTQVVLRGLDAPLPLGQQYAARALEVLGMSAD